MALLEISPITAATPPPPAPTGQSWKWQLRDKTGRWIQMGSEVTFSFQGKTITGVIVGSPKPGIATVRMADGKTVTVPTAGVTATGKSAPKPGAPGAPAAPGGKAAAPAKTTKAVVPALKDEKIAAAEKADAQRTSAEKADAQRAAAATKKKAASPAKGATSPARGNSKSRDSGGSTGGSTGGSSGSKSTKQSSTADDGGTPDDRRLNKIHRTSRSIEGLLRIQAKEQGRKDPFGESKSDSKSKDGGSKDGGSDSTESGAGSGASSDGAKKKPKKELKKLTQSQIDSVKVIMEAVLKHVKAGEYSTALGRLKNAKAILKDTSAPWLNKRIFFLTKGLKSSMGVTSSGAPEWTWDLALLAAGVRHVRTAEGAAHFDQPIGAVIVPDPLQIGDVVRHLPGGKSPKASLGEIIGRPVDDLGREKKGRMLVRTLAGKEIDVNEKTLTALPLDEIQEAVRKEGGLSTKIDGVLPTTGYMAAQTRGGAVGPDGKAGIPEDIFFGPDGKKHMAAFMRANAAQFDTDPDVYLGLWHDKENGRVTIDVSHNVQDRESAVLFGRYQDQREIWDVVKREGIDTGGTGGYADIQGVRAPEEEDRGDDGRGTGGVVPAGNRPDPPRTPPSTGPNRPSAVVSSMGGLDPQGYGFVNNGGGTLADPVHVYPYSATKESTDPETGVVTPATPARTLTVRQSDIAAHLKDVVEAAILHNKKANIKASEAAIAEARQWYVTAHDKAIKMQAKFNTKYPQANLTIQQVTGVIAAVSPRQGWDQNLVSAERVIEAYLTNADIRTLDDLKDETGAGLRSNVEIGLKILDGAGPEVMTGMKRKSFWNNLMDPNNPYDITVDGWMASSIWRMGGTYSDGTPVNEKALSWIDHSTTDVVKGAGYIIVADAIRDVARDLAMTPSEVQAVYWVAVGGGQLNTQMWSDEPKRTEPELGYNLKGQPTWVKVGDVKDDPFHRWWVVRPGPEHEGQLSPATDTSFHRYGHFSVTRRKGREGWRWDVYDTAPGGAGVTVSFKTKKEVEAHMATLYPEGPPPLYAITEERETEGVEETITAIKRVPSTHPFSWKGAPYEETQRRLNEARRRGGLVASGINVITLDEDGGEWSDPTDYDAVAIGDMAITFQKTTGPVNGIRSAWERSGPHPTAGQITWCWENPDAWPLAGVDREWFAEQVVSRVPLAYLSVA